MQEQIVENTGNLARMTAERERINTEMDMARNIQTSALPRPLLPDPEALVLHMHDAVNGFAASAEQFDDITMLCMKYNGPQKPDGHPERN